VQADFQNYRKRVEQERGENSKAARAEIIANFLPVLDDFQRGIESIPDGSRGLPWVQGMTMVERKLQNVLDAAGVAIIDPKGAQFDPWEHEAVLHEPTSQYEAGAVIDVLRLGYKMDGKVIRPAQVKVAAPVRPE
jgi:molecular chaperone GrpE